MTELLAKDAKPHLIRQFDLVPQNILSEKITIIGAGAIGGWACLLLTKMGFCNVELWDYDTVSLENMNCQPYSFNELEMDKTSAMKQRCKDFGQITINDMPIAWEGHTLTTRVLLCCADSMAVRRNAFEMAKKSTIDLVIDTRMGAEFGQIFSYNPHNAKACENYEKTLFTDEEAEPLPCTAKSTIYCANILSGMVTKIVKDYLVGKIHPRSVFLNLEQYSTETYF